MRYNARVYVILMASPVPRAHTAASFGGRARRSTDRGAAALLEIAHIRGLARRGARLRASIRELHHLPKNDPGCAGVP